MTVERIPIVDREEWLGWRKRDVTASQIAAVFGVHPYTTLAALHAAKTGLDIPGPDPEAAHIRRGNALEPVVAAEVAKMRPDWRIRKCTEYFRDPDARIGATPDYEITGPSGRGILQIKTVSAGKFRREWGNPDDISPPLWVTLQTAVEMMLTDAGYGAVAVLSVGEYEFSTQVIDLPERNRKAEHRIRVAVHSFWQALDAGQVPTIDYERDGELIKLMYPIEVAGKVIDLRGDNRMQDLLEIREANAGVIKIAEKAKSAAETEMREKMGDAEIALVNGWKVSLRTTEVGEQVRKAYSFRALRTARETVE